MSFGVLLVVGILLTNGTHFSVSSCVSHLSEGGLRNLSSTLGFPEQMAGITLVIFRKC